MLSCFDGRMHLVCLTRNSVPYLTSLPLVATLVLASANDCQFFDADGQSVLDISEASINVVAKVRITWCIQKNHQNNQKVTLSCNKTHPTICPVLAALRLVLRARCLSQPDSMPVACYLKKGVLAYLTGSRIAFHFQAAARAVRPNITKDEEH